MLTFLRLKNVKKRKKIIIWQAYFDSSKTREKGRKIPKKAAIPNPNLRELQSAALKLGLKPEAEVNSSHPIIPWRKSGRVLIHYKGTKMQALMKIAEELAIIRQQEKK